MISICSQRLAWVKDVMERVELMHHKIDPLGLYKMRF